MINLELDRADNVDVAETNWQCESSDLITMNLKRAVLIKDVLPFLTELSRYLEDDGAWRWSSVKEHSMLKRTVFCVPVVNVFVLAVQNIRPDPVAQLGWKAQQCFLSDTVQGDFHSGVWCHVLLKLG